MFVPGHPFLPRMTYIFNSPRAFFNSVLINGDKQLRECSAKPFKSIDGSPCAYMDVRLLISLAQEKIILIHLLINRTCFIVWLWASRFLS